MSISIYDGDMDNGKSTMLAWVTWKLLKRNKQWAEENKIAVRRIVYTTQELAKWLYDEFDGYLKYIDPVHTLEIAPGLEECDFIYDDMNMDLDGQHYMDTPRDFKGWLRQCGHRGVDIYGNTQDFVTLDPTVRRLSKNIYNVKMILGNERPAQSKPPVKKLRGLIIVRDVPMTEFKKEKPERIYAPVWQLWTIKFHLFNKFKASLFNTNQKMIPASLPPYKCYERGCTNPEHVDTYGRPFKQFYHAK